MVQIKESAGLYEEDFYAWIQNQAAKLRARAHAEIDWENIAEEIESLGRRERLEIRERLRALLVLLLKWDTLPGLRSHTWQSRISEERDWIQATLDDSPSLREFPTEIIENAYFDARRRAADETGLRASAFPRELPYAIDKVFDPSFWPGEPQTLLLRD